MRRGEEGAVDGGSARYPCEAVSKWRWTELESGGSLKKTRVSNGQRPTLTPSRRDRAIGRV